MPSLLLIKAYRMDIFLDFKMLHADLLSHGNTGTCKWG